MNNKQKELQEKLILRRLERVYCKLAPSPIHGIGIFAIKDIPKDTNPFKDSYMAQESILISKDKIKNVNPEYLDTLSDYHPNSGNGFQVVSKYPNQPIWTNYLNYSYTDPNIELMTDGEWKTSRVIKKGEELLENPNKLFNDDGSQKVFMISPNQYPKLG